MVAVEIRDPGSEYLLNHCTKYLSRAGSPPELGDDDSAAAFRARIAEAWRFPIIGPVREPRPDNAPSANLVTFVYKMPPRDARVISVLGTFGTLYNPIPHRYRSTVTLPSAVEWYGWLWAGVAQTKGGAERECC